MPDSPSKLFPNDEAKDVQARKRRRFVWKNGVLGWGWFMFVWMTAFEWYTKGYIRLPPLRPLLWSIIPNLIIFPVAGYWWGVTVWRHKRDSD